MRHNLFKALVLKATLQKQSQRIKIQAITSYSKFEKVTAQRAIAEPCTVISY